MRIKKRMAAAMCGIAVLGLVFGSEACSSAEKSANTAAAQPVNVQTPTVQEIIDAKKREQQAAKEADPMYSLQKQAERDRKKTEFRDPRMSSSQLSEFIRQAPPVLPTK
jgi:hypothetical protein